MTDLRQLPDLDWTIPGIHLGRRERGPIEPWHYVGGLGEPGMNATWVNGNGGDAVKFRKRPDGFVEVAGAVDLAGVNGAGPNRDAIGTAFALPVGYRPPMLLAFQIYYLGFPNTGGTQRDIGTVLVGTDGAVFVIARGTSWGSAQCTFSPIGFHTIL